MALFRGYLDVGARAVAVTPGHQTLMPWYSYAGMSEEDLGALYDHLSGLPPIANVVDVFPDRGTTP